MKFSPCSTHGCTIIRDPEPKKVLYLLRKPKSFSSIPLYRNRNRAEIRFDPGPWLHFLTYAKDSTRIFVARLARQTRPMHGARASRRRNVFLEDEGGQGREDSTTAPSRRLSVLLRASSSPCAMTWTLQIKLFLSLRRLGQYNNDPPRRLSRFERLLPCGEIRIWSVLSRILVHRSMICAIWKKWVYWKRRRHSEKPWPLQKETFIQSTILSPCNKRF